MSKLIDIAYDDTRPAAVQLDAIKDSLNRAGIVKPAQVEVGPIKLHQEIFDNIAGGSRSAYRDGSGFIDGLEDSANSEAGDLILSRDYLSHDPTGPFLPFPPAPATRGDGRPESLSSPQSRPEPRPHQYAGG